MAPVGPLWFWGGLHRLYLAIERMLRRRFRGYRPGGAATAALGLLTFVLVNIAWVFFRAKTFPQATLILSGMFGGNTHAPPMLAGIYLVTTTVIIAGLLAARWSMRNQTLEATIARAHPAALTASWAVMAFAVVIQHGESNGFIYFQF
jgi:alginate O-acetyltransferase complex protein AlgI